jgi:5-formyltetrahydrofolate cyclo-ligase
LKDKPELRKTVRDNLAALSPKELTAAGSAAACYLGRIPRWNEFPSALAFFSMNNEIDTRPVMEAILQTGKSLFVPRIKGEDLAFYQIGQNDLESSAIRFGGGFREPEGDPRLILKPEDFPVLVITPGLAFDRRMNRLGRGKGYYDRFFASLDSKESHSAGRSYTALGLCMDCQVVEEVPVEPWDKRMDLLLTESGIISC